MKGILIAGIAAAAIGLTACGSRTTIVKTVVAPSTTTSTSTSEAASAPDKTSARVGEVLRLRGQDTTLEVRVVAVTDPLAGGEYDEAESGRRFVGVQLAIRNVGSEPFSDAVSNGATLITAGDQQAKSTIVSGGPCGNDFGSDIKLAPDDRRVGCIPFEVTSGTALRSFQFTPDSGFAEATGEWRIQRTVSGGSPAPAPSSSDSQESSAPNEEGDLTSCDANISASVGRTTCPFAQNVFYEYFKSGQSSDVSAYSPAAGQTYSVACEVSSGSVTCTTDDGALVRFPQSAVASYSQAQAERYAATHSTRR